MSSTMPLVAPVALLLAALAGPAQEAQTLPDDQEIVAAWIKDVAKIHRKREKDAETIALLEKLRAIFPQSGPDDRQRIADITVDCLTVRRKPLDGEAPKKTWMLPLAAAEALGDMHPESAKDLAKAARSKSFREHYSLFGAVVESTARACDEDAIKLLLGLLDAKDDVWCQARLVNALRHFESSPEEARKEIFEEVVDVYLDVSDRMDDNNDLAEGLQIALLFKTYANETLRALSGHSESTPEDWERWWKDNRREPWPEPEKPQEPAGPQ